MRKLLCLLAAVSLIFGVACGGGEEEVEPAANEEAAEEDTGDEHSGAGAGTELEFVGTEFAFAGPASAPAAELTITFTNNGEQPHEMATLPLKEGAPKVEELAKLPEKELQKYAAGPFGGTEGPVKPGESKTFEVDTTQAGSVAFVCFVRDPKTKKPHVELGMLGSFVVES
ncbi:MAG: hypothetical protein KY391_02035 [Actinobacteria bacterium]|nr:hypothetical protein [Actinomycetota bacterium]